jgi:hypothetical protein
MKAADARHGYAAPADKEPDPRLGCMLIWEKKRYGAGGVRTRDLLDAIEARSQLRYGPTGKVLLTYNIRLASRQTDFPWSCCRTATSSMKIMHLRHKTSSRPAGTSEPSRPREFLLCW